MAKKILNNLDFSKNEIQNARIQNLSSAPGTPVEGQMYYDTTKKQLGVYSNGIWEYKLTTSTSTSLGTSDTISPTQNAIKSYVDTGLGTKQATLVSGTNIKTINSTSLLGSGDIAISGATNLSIANRTTNTLDVLSDTGTDVTLPAATTSLSGLLTGSDKTKLDGIATGATANTGTVTSVAAITLGTSGTDLGSSVATGTTTPVITLNVPTASATNRGALSSTDWSTFNNKQATLVSGTNIKTVGGVTLLGSGDVSVGVTSVAALTLGTTGTDVGSSVANGTSTAVITLNIPTASATNRGALSSTDWSTFNNKQAALVSGTSIKTINSTSLLASGDIAIPIVRTGAGVPGAGLGNNGDIYYRTDNTNALWFKSGGSWAEQGGAVIPGGGTTTQILAKASNTNFETEWIDLEAVTSVAALTIGTTGTDLSSSVATSTTTPVITLNVPTASATNRGALSSTDWSTFNNKQAALGATLEIDNITSNNNTTFPTTKAVRAYVATLTSSAFVYIGAIDCSTNPNYPAGTKGEYRRVSVAGKIGGASGIAVTAGDSIICNTSNAGGYQATVGTNWDIIQGNLEDATTSLKGVVQLATSAEAKAKSDTAKAVTPASLADFPRMYVTTLTGSTGSPVTAYTVTHNLGTRNVMVQIREAMSPYGEVIVDNEATTTNTVTVTFAVAPTTGNDYTAMVLAL